MTQVRSEQLEGAVVQTIQSWATAHPIELVQFDQQMKSNRSQLNQKSGMSEKKHLKHYGEIPASLHAKMCFRFGKDWTIDVRLRTLFWSHFKVGKLNLTASPVFQVANTRSEM